MFLCVVVTIIKGSKLTLVQSIVHLVYYWITTALGSDSDEILR